ncbi:histidine phosphatase family protein [Paenibacillus sp. 22594]|uniref:histidine phosphatase family protein n=1 Tax=Paenibacillus sp. 22594 TaxID=3453947 RepID=UPI003F848D12
MANDRAGLDAKHILNPESMLGARNERKPEEELNPEHEPDPGHDADPECEPDPENGQACESKVELQVELELVLIRHGHTQWNAEHRYLGSTDLPLLPESEVKLSALRHQPELAGTFWRVYCSDLRRCRETLAVIAPSLGQSAVYDSRLREMSFGAWEGQNYEQLQNNPSYRSWIDDPTAFTPSDGESWAEFTGRVESFLSELLHIAAEAPGLRNGPFRVLIVTHGGVIRQMLARTTAGLCFREAAAPPPGTATTVRLRWRGGEEGSCH